MELKKNSFHLSVDDVLPSLLDVSSKDLRLTDNVFFKTLRTAWELYGVKTGLNLFYECYDNELLRSLQDVRCLTPEILDDWIFFGPHALNNETPPYCQTIEDQIQTFDRINHQIDRIAHNKKSQSIRLHHYSECYENAEYFLANGVGEIFTTDKSVGLHRLGSHERECILKNGSILKNGLKLTRTHYRVEDLANQNVTKNEFILMARKCINDHQRIIIYSHEYEHKRDVVNKMFLNVVKWLVDDLRLECDRP